MVKQIIFDADGVLLLSTESGINCLIKAISISGLSTPSFNDIKKIWGQRLEAELIPNLAKTFNWPKGGAENVIDLFLDLSNDLIYPEQPDLIPALEFLAKRYKLGIASNRDIKSLSFRLEQQGINKKLFSHIQTADNGISKPNPKFFQPFWNGPGFSPEHTLYIGDNVLQDLGVALAHEPPLSFAAIASDSDSVNQFISAGLSVERIFKRVAHIPGMIDCL